MATGTDAHADGVRIGLSGISKSYGPNQVLEDITLDIDAGTVHALVGANGAGKSTLGKIIAGVTQPDTGQLLVNGEAAHWARPRDARRAGIAMIAQELALVPDLTVMENIFLGDPPRRFGVASRRGLARRYGELVERWGFDLGAETLVRSLRLADRQIVEILRAVASGARVLVMDEPTSSLTDVEIKPLKRMIRSLRAGGSTIVYVSHFLDDVLELADTITVLRDGRAVQTAAVADTSEEAVMRAMFGEALVAEHLPKQLRSDAVPVLEVSGLSRGRVLNEISLTIHEGEVVGLAGLVGSGRSELARAIFGADSTDGGTVAVDGHQLRIRGPADAIRAGIAFVPESRKTDGLFLDLPISSNTTIAHLRSVASRFRVVRQGAERQAAYAAMQEYAIAASSADARVGTLSGGNQQKVLFAKWLFRPPRVLLLDEPTRGVDVHARAGIHRLVGQLAKDGVAILFISSELEEVLAVAHRTLVMSHGRIVDEFGTDPPLDAVMEATLGSQQPAGASS